jgi:ATP-binding cassette, subfamily B, bacterial PglK
MISSILGFGVYKNTLKIFNTNKNFTFIFILLLNGLFEISLSVLFPLFLLVYFQTEKSNFITELINDYGLNDFSLIYLFILYLIIRSIVLFFGSRYFSKTIFDIQSKISHSFLMNHINNNFSKIKDSSLVTTSVIEVKNISYNFLIPISYIIQELGVILFALSAFLVINLQFTISLILIIVLMGILLIVSSKKSLQKSSLIRDKYEREQVKFVNAIEKLRQELFVYKIQKLFGNKFYEKSKKVTGSEAVLFFINIISRSSIELIVVFTIVVILFFAKYYGIFKISIEEVIFFAFLGMRLLPSFNKISLSIQAIKFADPLILKLEKHLNTNDLKSKIKHHNKGKIHKILIKDLSFNYNKTKIFEKFNFEINFGDKVAVRGYSGSGKSTLIKLIMGLLTPTSGSVQFVDNNNNQIIPTISYVPQKLNFFPGTVLQNITFKLTENEKIDKEKLNFALKFSGLGRMIENKIVTLDSLMSENEEILSGGQEQRLLLARALYQKPDILILDEPSSALDDETETEIFSDLAFGGKIPIIIIISHKDGPLNNCNKKIVLI